ncbi:p21-activated protein kinase-interacting protein 1-like [Scyliorhinus canicula]|uniref:p21-activated protein kinase-interacting protein 1-like n=1 Tax=Scyliorhinus canicula TaxID=7830 RepID=UPI0018F4D4EA|nr:p21-activated protein kinase-interacting protein 1-like [Scyliorhinus canicula]
MEHEASSGCEVLLVAGCYEQIIFGLSGKETGASGYLIQTYCLVKGFSGIGSCYQIETVERIFAAPAGTVTCLEFYGTTHLLTGAEDGIICVWDTKKWECLKSIPAHKGQVSSLSVHPSGKLALSVGTDKTLRTWNLINGKPAFIKNIKQNAQIVQWSPGGNSYIVASNNQLDIYTLETASINSTIMCKKRISSVKFITESIIGVAGEEEHVRLYDTNSKMCISEFKAHDIRVKAMHFFQVAQYHILATASNDGYIKLWQIDIKKLHGHPFLLSEVNTSARLTCLAVWLSNPTSIVQEIEEQEDAASNKHCKEKENKIKVASLDEDEYPKRGWQPPNKRKMAASTKERRKKNKQ